MLVRKLKLLCECNQHKIKMYYYNIVGPKHQSSGLYDGFSASCPSLAFYNYFSFFRQAPFTLPSTTTMSTTLMSVVAQSNLPLPQSLDNVSHLWFPYLVVFYFFSYSSYTCIHFLPFSLSDCVYLKTISKLSYREEATNLNVMVI